MGEYIQIVKRYKNVTSWAKDEQKFTIKRIWKQKKKQKKNMGKLDRKLER